MAIKSLTLWVIAIAAALALHGALSQAAPATEQALPQEMLQLPVRVLDADGKPIEGAKVIPWALRCSQGHGRWRVDGFGKSEPPTFTTDADGRAEISYPRYAEAEELVRTTEVTLSIDHPDFAYVSHENINVPMPDEGPHAARLQRGTVVEIVPLENGRPAALEGLHLKWSDSRSSKPGVSPRVTDDGAFQIPTMAAGMGEIVVVRLEGERATHFSPFVRLDLNAGERMRERVELNPCARIEGALSDNVPRPVKNGRLSARTVPQHSDGKSVHWPAWTPVAEDGTFVIEAWPATEDAQIIALSDGYIAESGAAPPVVKTPPNPDSFQRPQVFSPQAIAEPIVLRMKPTVRCEIETVDQHGAPLAGIEVWSCPNVGWWNVGSQIYCTPLVRGEQWLLKREYYAAVDQTLPSPFKVTTDADGRAELYLPEGTEDLYLDHDDFELPVVRGSREHEVKLVAGATTSARLVLQLKGTEYLGDWDKLAGVLFGCRGEECRRLLEDPGFRSKMVKVGKQFDDAADPTDPALLRSAYAEIAAGFDELKDQEEAEKWRRKSAEQAAKAALPVDAAPAQQP